MRIVYCLIRSIKKFRKLRSFQCRVEEMRITGQNVRDALIRALADEYSRKILLGTIDRARSVEELSASEQIPISTVVSPRK